MGSIGGEDLTQWDSQGLSARGEKIFVAVRLRPLNEKELARHDASDWECINNNTIIFKRNLAERSLFPTSYTFDRVFGHDCSTEQVYQNGVKNVALSVVNGINSSVFAYGQTSSGKTYTMSGITGYTMADIYDYIGRHDEREFILKFSALEIYNESVKDLLSSDSSPLRLLDDPERGTVVDKLTEATLRDWSHLMELLSVCEAQRQIGETSLNEMSSRSHQILRLTVESSARALSGAHNSSTLAATVNFIDLAGSERASQTSSRGVRLKEGCHINRSLLTLGTVIRKLSKGRNAHIPYRDSKLTRILQNYLGGNARTAIICTLSPAHSHLEQSRNTLVFASCAKEVNTNAQVNVVMSEKALVKQLQRELARLESELQSLGSMAATCDSAAALKEKELLIQKMGKEITDLTHQRDHAQSRVEDLLRTTSENQVYTPWDKRSSLDEYSASEISDVFDPLRLDVASTVSYLSDRCDSLKCDQELPENSEDQFLSDNTSPRIFIDKYFGPDPSQGWEKTAEKKYDDSEDNSNEVQCAKMESRMDQNSNPDAVSFPQKESKDLDRMRTNAHTHQVLKQMSQDMQETIDFLADPYSVELSPCSSDTDISCCRNLDQGSRTKSCRAIIMTSTSPPWSGKVERNEDMITRSERDFTGSPDGDHLKHAESRPSFDSGAHGENLCRKDSSKSSSRTISMDGQEENINKAHEEDIGTHHTHPTELDEMIKPKPEMEFANDTVKEAEANTNKSGITAKDDGSIIYTVHSSLPSPSNWPLEFERQRMEIIELWDMCTVPLVHRTYFFLLFKGDPSDSVYMEVELRRLSFLKQSLYRGNKIVTPASSVRLTKRERKMLSRQILKKFSSKEREALYHKWGIRLDSKQRKLQVARRIWTDAKDMDHIKESAALVAKLVGPAGPGLAPKEMFGLSFSPQSMDLTSFC